MPLPPALSLSLFYLTAFAVLGVYLPYLNLYLKAVGLTGLQIGLVSALVPLAGALAPAAGGILSDRIGRRRVLVVASNLLALLAFALLPQMRAFGGIALVVASYAVLRAPALPLVEASAVEIAEAGGAPYGRMRVWGSLAFIAASLAAGPLVARWGERVVPPLVILLLALNALSSLVLPTDTARPAAARGGSGLGALLLRPRVALFLLACLLSQASHGPYYVFYSIHLKTVGYSPQAIGLLWALAVGCEVVAMLRMPSILARFGTLPIIACCLLLSSVRWWICAVTAAPLAMAAAQTLHAASYAAFHVAAVTHTHRVFGAERRASGQAIYSSATYGVGNVLGMFVSGVLYDRTTMATLFAGASWAALLGGFLVLAAARREGGPRRGL